MSWNWLITIWNDFTHMFQYEGGQNNLLDGFVIGAIAALIGAVIDLVVTNMSIKDSLDTKSGWREKLFVIASKEKLKLNDVHTLRATLRFKPKDETKTLKNSVITNMLNIFLNTLLFLIFFLVFQLFLGKLLAFIISLVMCLFSKCILVWMEWDNFSYFFENCGWIKSIDTKNLYIEVVEDDEYNFDNITLTIIRFCESINSKSIKSRKVQKKLKIYIMYMLKHHWEELSVPNYRIIKKIQVRIKDNKNIKVIMEMIKEVDVPTNVS